MIRKRRSIDIDIKRRKEFLEETIEESLRAEKECEEEIVSLNKKLSELASEVCFEDTFEGKIKTLEKVAFEKIENILSKLSEATGKEYGSESLSAISLGDLWHKNRTNTLTARISGGRS